MFADADHCLWMRRALDLAAAGRCGASPNPMVGAVVLDAAGMLAGEGYHACCGGPHAEVSALVAAGERTRAGTVYVTLEPCAHHGRTPPCIDALLAAAPRRVVIAMRDPNPIASGGLERLAAAGIEVVCGVEEDAARSLNRRWLTFVEQRRPWVTLKAAVSLDGRIATVAGESKWITGEAARRAGLELREEHDAIMVGVGTVVADDPRLTRRLGLNPSPHWRRVVLDPTLRTPTTATLLDGAGEVVLMHGAGAPEERRLALSAAGATLVETPCDASGRIDLDAVLRWLAAADVAAVLVEGGAQVHGSFTDARLVDEIVVFVAPLILGAGAAAVAGRGAESLAAALRLELESVERVGDDVCLRAARAAAGATGGDDVHRAG